MRHMIPPFNYCQRQLGLVDVVEIMALGGPFSLNDSGNSLPIPVVPARWQSARPTNPDDSLFLLMRFTVHSQFHSTQCQIKCDVLQWVIICYVLFNYKYYVHCNPELLESACRTKMISCYRVISHQLVTRVYTSPVFFLLSAANSSAILRSYSERKRSADEL